MDKLLNDRDWLHLSDRGREEVNEAWRKIRVAAAALAAAESEAKAFGAALASRDSQIRAAANLSEHTPITQCYKEIVRLANEGRASEAKTAQLREVLGAVDKLLEPLLEKFDWSSAWLDADTIRLLNEVPPMVKATLSTTETEE